MIWAILVFSFVVWLTISEENGTDLGFRCIIGTLCGAFAASMLVVMQFAIFELFLSSEKINYPSDPTKIYSLRLEKNTTADFFLGSGEIDSQLEYYFYYDFRGGKRLGWVDADKAVIVEDGKNEIVKYYEAAARRPSIWMLVTIDTEQMAWVEIHVPKNTVIIEFGVK